MLIWELSREPDGTECLQVRISPETPPTAALSTILNLTRLYLMEGLEALEDLLPDGDSETPNDSTDWLSGRMSQRPWDYPNSN